MSCMEDLDKIDNICTCMVGSLIEVHFFGIMKEDEGAQGGDRDNVVLDKAIQHVQICCQRDEIDEAAC